MTDLAQTILPKTDQLNADTLLAGPMTITVTAVKGCDDPTQPIAIHFEGGEKTPYKPCKSMRRVLVHCWGADGNTFVGRRMTLFCDPEVVFGGIKVGGIDQVEQQGAGMAVRDHRVRRNRLAAGQFDPDRLAPARQHPRDRGVGADRRRNRLRRGRHGRGLSASPSTDPGSGEEPHPQQERAPPCDSSPVHGMESSPERRTESSEDLFNRFRRRPART